MRCNCPIDDRTCRIDSKLFHLTNRTNRSNRQHFVHFSLIKWNFSDRQQIERCFVGWTLCDSIGHEWVNSHPFAWLNLSNTARTTCDLGCEFSSSFNLKVYWSALSKMKCKQHSPKLEWYGFSCVPLYIDFDTFELLSADK